MAEIKLAIVGCGGMGHRHLYGLAELERAGLNRFALVGACDPVRENAESLADDAAKHFGRRPAVAERLDELSAAGVEAIDIAASPRVHHTIAIEALARGWHVMLEKPMGLTVHTCNEIRHAARRSDLVVSVAENYRRDPINRLAKALLEAGTIGDPRLLIHQTVGGGNKMTITTWRHQKDQSGVLLDVGVHFADMMEYFLGDIVSVYAQTRLHERIRVNPVASGTAKTSSSAEIYERWQRRMPAEFEATAEDAVYATLLFKSGAVAQYLEDHAGHGQSIWSRRIHGSAGSLDLPGDRSGRTITVGTGDGRVIDDAKVLDLAPEFRLDAATAALFGADRLWRYDLPFPETDRKIIAIEYADFAEAIAGDRKAEVTAEQGARSVAITYAMLESGVAGRAVTIEETLAEQIDAYQHEIDQGLPVATGGNP